MPAVAPAVNRVLVLTSETVPPRRCRAPLLAAPRRHPACPAHPSGLHGHRSTQPGLRPYRRGGSRWGRPSTTAYRSARTARASRPPCIVRFLGGAVVWVSASEMELPATSGRPAPRDRAQRSSLEDMDPQGMSRPMPDGRSYMLSTAGCRGTTVMFFVRWSAAPWVHSHVATPNS